MAPDSALVFGHKFLVSPPVSFALSQRPHFLNPAPLAALGYGS